MDLDFTLTKYQELCEALQEHYTTCTVHEYLTKYQSSSNPDTPEGQNTKVAILRHDVDRKIKNALHMAKLEHDQGIQSSYYFRYPYTFKPEIIRQIQALSHEVGYHYETLSKAKGDVYKASTLFEKELTAFRNICEVKTICMHGSPLSPYNNRDLWKHLDYKNYGIIGESTLSIVNVPYLTDTGRSWNSKNNIRDNINGITLDHDIETTNELIAHIQKQHYDKPYLTIHPERWSVSTPDWIVGNIIDISFNIGKIILKAVITE